VSRTVKPSAKRLACMRSGYLLAVLLGAYAFIWALTACAAIVLHGLGLPRSEAVIICSLLGLLLYPAVVLYAFAARRVLPALGLLGAGCAALLVVAQLAGAG
jgi:hypothetical protein